MAVFNAAVKEKGENGCERQLLQDTLLVSDWDGQTPALGFYSIYRLLSPP